MIVPSSMSGQQLNTHRLSLKRRTLYVIEPNFKNQIADHDEAGRTKAASKSESEKEKKFACVGQRRCESDPEV